MHLFHRISCSRWQCPMPRRQRLQHQFPLDESRYAVVARGDPGDASNLHVAPYSFDSFKWFMKTILFSRYQCDQRIRGYFYNEMRYINLRFTYLLTYLLGCWQVDALSVYQHDQRLLCVVWRLKIRGGATN